MRVETHDYISWHHTRKTPSAARIKCYASWDYANIYLPTCTMSTNNNCDSIGDGSPCKLQKCNTDLFRQDVVKEKIQFRATVWREETVQETITNQPWQPSSHLSRCGLAVRRLAGKQKDLGSIRLGSPFSSLQKLWFMDTCLVTLPTQLMKHQNGSHNCPP